MFEAYMKKEIQKYEEMCLNGHVALNTVFYDGWILKFSEGYTGRANSVSLLYPSSLPVADKVVFCEQMYQKQKLPCQFKLTELDTELNDFLEKRGYEVATPTDLMVCDLGCPVEPDNDNSSPDNENSSLDSYINSPDDNSQIEYVFSKTPEEWLPVFFKIHEINDAHDQDVYTRMVAKVLVDTIYCTVLYKGKPAACSSAAIENGYMLLQNVIVSSELRGHGLGKKVCSAILKKAYEAGAQHSYLQVVQTNTVAVNLYKKLGFEKLYSYWYMKN
jgi:GNAT superfamily N-acetyltransferase